MDIEEEHKETVALSMRDRGVMYACTSGGVLYVGVSGTSDTFSNLLQGFKNTRTYTPQSLYNRRVLNVEARAMLFLKSMDLEYKSCRSRMSSNYYALLTHKDIIIKGERLPGNQARMSPWISDLEAQHAEIYGAYTAKHPGPGAVRSHHQQFGRSA